MACDWDMSRSRAPSRVSVIDFTPDWLVTRKNRGSIGTPISDDTVHRHGVFGNQGVAQHEEHQGRLTERFCLVPLIIFPKRELEHGSRGKIILDQVVPVCELQLL